MPTATTTFTLNLPTADATLLRSLAKRFGWTARKQKPAAQCPLDKALSEYEKGETKTFGTVDELMSYLND